MISITSVLGVSGMYWVGCLLPHTDFGPLFRGFAGVVQGVSGLSSRARVGGCN